MPYPSQINPDQIVTTAATMIEAGGVEALSLTRLAEALGVKAPSLYRYYDGKTALLRAVNTLTRQIIISAVVRDAYAAGSPRAGVQAMAHTYRAEALARPAAYGLAYTNTIDDLRVSEEALLENWTSLVPVAARYVGEGDALVFMNGLWALAHGYVMLEICQNLRLDTDRDAAFRRVVDAYLDGWA